VGALKKGKPIERWGRKATGLTTAIVHDSGVASDEIKSLPMYAERCRRVPYLFSSQLPPVARVHGLTAIGVGSSIELGSVTMSNLRKNLRAGLGVAGLVGLIMALAGPASAEPAENSISDIEACLDDDSTVKVCSSKELSNVIVQCTDGESSYYIKYDDLEDLVDPYVGFFACPGATVESVYVKSGSGKFGDGTDGLSAGTGVRWEPSECPVECPPTGEDDGEDPGTEPPPDGETPL
jgi:hypothetical protein